MDTSRIEAIAAAVSLSLALGGVGVSVALAGAVAENAIDTTIKASVTEVSAASTGSLVATAGNVLIDAKDEASIRVISAAAAIALAGGISAGIAVSGAGALAFNRITNKVSSEVIGATISAASATAMVPSGNTIAANAAVGSPIFNSSGTLLPAYTGALTIARDAITGAPIYRPIVSGTTITGYELALVPVTGPTVAGDPVWLPNTDADAQALREYKYKSEQVTRQLLVPGSDPAEYVEDITTQITFEDPTTANAGLLSVWLPDPDSTDTGATVVAATMDELVAGPPIPQNISVTATGNADIDAAIISAAVSLGIGGAAGIGVAVGTSYAKNEIGANNSATGEPSGVFAHVDRATLEASNNITVSAAMTSEINALVGSFSVALAGGYVGVSGAGAGAFPSPPSTTLGVNERRPAGLG